MRMFRLKVEKNSLLIDDIKRQFGLLCHPALGEVTPQAVGIDFVLDCVGLGPLPDARMFSRKAYIHHMTDMVMKCRR